MKAKITAILILTFALVMGGNAVVLWLVVYPAFTVLEEREATRNMERVLDAFENDARNLKRVTNDWASWDDAYAYVEDRNSEFIETNLIPETFRDSELALVYLFDLDGQVVWGQGYDPDAEAFHGIPALEDPKSPLIERLTGHSATVSAIEGLISTDRGYVLVASYPILTSEDQGPARGCLIMGRLIDEGYIRALGGQVHTDLLMVPSDREGSIRPSAGEIILARDSPTGTLDAYSRLETLLGDSGPVLLARNPRDITAAGRNTLVYSVVTLLLLGATVLVVVLMTTDRALLRPLVKLSRTIIALGQGGGDTRKLPLNRKDELGEVARAVERMYKHIVRFAHHDTLTGLPNRLLFYDRTGQLLKRVAAERGKVVLMLFDLEDFGAVNEQHGAHVADNVLTAVADRLRDHLRDYDIVSRLGDDEFVVAIGGLHSAEDAEEKCQTVLSLFDAPFHIGEREMAVGCRLGAALFPDQGGDLDHLIGIADAALKTARADGTNRCDFSNEKGMAATG